MRWAFLLLFSLVVACSSDDAPGDSGSGGAGSGRVCVPGATQQCIGPGACDGGQACAFDGSGWGPCDCGGSAGGAGGASGAPASGAGGAEPTAGRDDGGASGQGPAGAGGAAGQPGAGAAGEPGQAGAGGAVDDAMCATLASDACQDCCEANHPGVQKDFATDLVGCACFGACVNECTDICSGASSGEVCNQCLLNSFASGSCSLDSCASPGCQAFSKCVLSCP